MRFRSILGGATASALLASSFVIGFAGSASAVIFTATHLGIVTQPSATGANGVALTTQPVISFLDGSNAVDTAENAVVTATISVGGTSVSNATATAVSGVATFSGLALNALTGNYTLTFASPSIASVVSTNIAISAGPATKLAITTQPSLGEVSGSALVQQPVVKVEDNLGNVVTTDTSSVAVVCTPACTSAPTGAPVSAVGGVATFATLTLTAPVDVNYTLTFSDGALTTAVSTNIAMTGPADKLLMVTQPPATATNGVALIPQPAVRIADVGGFTLLTNTSNVTATVTSAAVGETVTNGIVAAVSGVATFSGLAINALQATHTLTFSDASLTPAVSTGIAVSIGAAAKLNIVTQPAVGAASGSALGTQPVVQIVDSGGNVITSNASIVTATITSGGVSVTNATATASGGIANFSGLALNAPVGSYTLTFSDASLTTAVSTSIAISVGAPAKLVITTQPSVTATNGVALVQQPVVKIEDSGNNVVTTATTTVTATFTSGGVSLTNAAAIAAAGVATFAGLTLNAASGAYTLTFSDGVLTPAVSTSIAMGIGVAAKLVIQTQPSATTASGAVLAQQPIVLVEDAGGNIITADTSTVTAKITTGGVSVTSATKAAVAGVATFSGLALNALVGTYTLTFTDGTLATTVSSNVAVTIGTPTQLMVVTEPSAKTTSGVALAQQPVVKVADSGGNVVATVNTGSVTASIFTGVGGGIAAGATAPFVLGVATFSGLAISGVSGTVYTLQYAGNTFLVSDPATITIGTAQAALTITSVSATLGTSLTLTTSGGSGTGAVTFALGTGTATGCLVAGNVLTFTSTGTCVVTATKAADTTYLVISSAATTVNVAKPALPGVLTLGYSATAHSLAINQRNAIIRLSRLLTTQSFVIVTAYAPGNLALAKSWAVLVTNYLHHLLNLRVAMHWVKNTHSRSVKIVTIR